MSTAPQVYSAIAAVQSDLAKVGISKDRKNQQQGYAFRGIDDVYGAVAPLLAQHRLCILPRVVGRSVIERETKAGGTLFYVVCEVEFDFVAAGDGSKHTVKMAGEAMDSGDKATNKAMSAAYKYACLQVFCIPTEGDNDADATTHDVAPKGAVARPQTAYATPNGAVTPKPDVRPAIEPESPPIGQSDWRSVIVPKFIKQYAGRTLGDMATEDLNYWADKYTPKPYNGSISPADIAFRASLDSYKAERDGAKKPDDADVPY